MHKEIKITRTVEGFTLVFKWQGGEYIDICWPSGEAFEVINVWNHHEDKAQIPFTRDALREVVLDWADAVDPHDLREYAYAR